MIALYIYLAGALAVFLWGIIPEDHKISGYYKFMFSLIGAIIYPIALLILPFHLFFVEYEVHLKLKKFFKGNK